MQKGAPTDKKKRSLGTTVKLTDHCSLTPHKQLPLSSTSSNTIYKLNTVYLNPSACDLCYSLKCWSAESVPTVCTDIFFMCSLLFPDTALDELQKVQQDTSKRQKIHKTHTRTLKHLHTHSHTGSGCRQRRRCLRPMRAGLQQTEKQRLEDDWWDSMKVVSCSRTETAGRRCCCWAGRGGQGRTAARPGWSAREEA